jgi:transposase
VFAIQRRRWWAGVDRHIVDVEREVAQQTVRDPWRTSIPFLLQLPGTGIITAMTILSAIGEITRFPSAKQLVGYSGLGARIHASGQTRWAGGITKCGRPELRTALIEVAWAAVRQAGPWQERFQRLEQRIGTQKAIVALARTLLVVIWHLLTDATLDRQADPAAIARRFARWGSRYGLAQSMGTDRRIFLHQMLQHLGLEPPPQG